MTDQPKAPEAPEPVQAAAKPPLTMPMVVSPEELQALLGGPAIFSNKVYVTGQGVGARITFSEANAASPIPQFRAAVHLDWLTVIALRDLLSSQIELLQMVIPEKPDSSNNG